MSSETEFGCQRSCSFNRDPGTGRKGRSSAENRKEAGEASDAAKAFEEDKEDNGLDDLDENASPSELKERLTKERQKVHQLEDEVM